MLPGLHLFHAGRVPHLHLLPVALLRARLPLPAHSPQCSESSGPKAAQMEQQKLLPGAAAALEAQQMVVLSVSQHLGLPAVSLWTLQHSLVGVPASKIEPQTCTVTAAAYGPLTQPESLLAS